MTAPEPLKLPGGTTSGKPITWIVDCEPEDREQALRALEGIAAEAASMLARPRQERSAS